MNNKVQKINSPIKQFSHRSKENFPNRKVDPMSVANFSFVQQVEDVN